MTTSANRVVHDDRAIAVEVQADMLHVTLADGRELLVPLAWFSKVLEASDEQRRNCRLIGPGIGINWPDIDEDISIRGLLQVS